MIKRLLPLFEQFASKEMTEAMRAQMDALGTAVPEELRQRDDDSVREGIRSNREKRRSGEVSAGSNRSYEDV